MKVDENGKELDAEQQHEAYLKYNEGSERHSQALTPTAKCLVP
jgi:hypothetical protein